MRSSEKEKLLDDLLRDANYEAFRAEVYELSAAEFRAKRRPSGRLIYFALAASVVLLGTVLSFSLRTKTSAPRMAASNAAAAPSGESSAKIATAFQKDRVPTFAFIATAALEPVDVVRSLSDITLLVSTPSRPTRGVEVVYSDLATVDPVTDAQLLALFPHEAVGFFHTAQGKKLVVIGDSEVSFRLPVAPPLIHGAIP
jgi:hypothetical protein